MASSGGDPKPRRPKRPPATTVEGRENQLIALATDVAERQMREGKASAQVITHFLKLATVREGLEREKLRRENILLEAKARSIVSTEEMERKYNAAIRAFRSYQGNSDEDGYDDQELFRAQENS